jgi:hypothetical protein
MLDRAQAIRATRSLVKAVARNTVANDEKRHAPAARNDDRVNEIKENVRARDRVREKVGTVAPKSKINSSTGFSQPVRDAPARPASRCMYPHNQIQVRSAE